MLALASDASAAAPAMPRSSLSDPSSASRTVELMNAASVAFVSPNDSVFHQPSHRRHRGIPGERSSQRRRTLRHGIIYSLSNSNFEEVARVPNIGAFHPQVVHFVVALLFAGVIFRLL